MSHSNRWCFVGLILLTFCVQAAEESDFASQLMRALFSANGKSQFTEEQKAFIDSIKKADASLLPRMTSLFKVINDQNAYFISCSYFIYRESITDGYTKIPSDAIFLLLDGGSRKIRDCGVSVLASKPYHFNKAETEKALRFIIARLQRDPDSYSKWVIDFLKDVFESTLTELALTLPNGAG